MTRPALCMVAFILAVIAWPGTTLASNGVHPRTPVVWNEQVCMQFVDRASDPVLRVRYDIPYEDTDITLDEVNDSRTHQFFAICRQHHAQTFLPNWITRSDVTTAAQKSLVDPAEVTDDEVLDTDATWSECWTRVTDDDARRPITFAMAREEILWNTEEIPAGDYVLVGYTHEPPFNLWSERYGSVVRVHDGGNPASRGPAATVTSSEDDGPLYAGEILPLTGCVDALLGSVIAGYYTSTVGAGRPEWEPSWIQFAQNLSLTGDTFEIEWTVPQAVTGGTVLLRIDITDPKGRTYTAHRFHRLSVLEGTRPDTCGSGFIANDCGSGTEGESDAQSGGTGCACHVGGDRHPLLAAAAILLTGYAVRRKRYPQSRAPLRRQRPATKIGRRAQMC